MGLLTLAAINAISYFFRSSDWSSLIGKSKSLNESVGFPWKVWEAGNTYGGMYADYPSMGLNILFATVVGSVIGVIAAMKRDMLNRLIEDLDDGSVTRTAQPVQFSLQSLMIATTVAAVFATVASKLAVHPETLIAIYVLGPICLVAVAMLPRRISWQRRVAIITPATLSLIAVAIAVGHGLGMEFDKVLMGIFLCWTPQSALAALALTGYLFVSLNSRMRQKSLLSGDDNKCV